MTAIVELKNATKVVKNGFDEEKIILNDVSLEIFEQDFITILGGNGAGKSTLFNTIAGTLSLTSGTIRILGEDVTKFSPEKRAKYLSRVFQDPKMGTAPRMTVAENLALANRRGQKRSLFKMSSKEELQQFEALLAPLGLGLEDRLHTEIGLLSGGQRQAISLLMATMNAPKLLLLDEHTAALDPETSNKILEKTKEIIEKNNITSLMITHNMQDAITYGNRLIMLHAGEVIFDIKGEEKKKLTVEKLLEMFKTKDAKLSDKDIF